MVLEGHVAEQSWPRRPAFEGLVCAHRQRSRGAPAGGHRQPPVQVLVKVKVAFVLTAVKR